MFSVTREFVNEDGNLIELTITSNADGVTIGALGPKSTVEHTWTRKEAEVIFDLLAIVNDHANVLQV